MRMILIGNGPSTTPEILDKLRLEDTMAVNRISLIYPKTKWRPTHYYKTDYTIGQNWLPEIMSHVLNYEQCLLWDAFKNGAAIEDINHHFIPDGIGDTYSNVRYVPRCSHVFEGTGTGVWDDTHFCLGLNSVLGMARWAVELGYDEIYMIGFDGNYREDKKDHCIENYYGQDMDVDYAKRNNEKTMEAHTLIYEKCPIPVYNCSKISVFGMHPYRDLEKVLNVKK
jgi:hypothetical protein